MIFVTVGTHEQPFNRLIEEVDRLKGENLITDDVVIQRGYSTYTPKYCQYYDLLPYEEMKKYISEARIVITHGGPASFIDVLATGKTPIVVPRQKKYNEHVNDHQLEFCKELKKRFFPLIVVEKIDNLYDEITTMNIKSSVNYSLNNKNFVFSLINNVNSLFKKGNDL